MCRINVTSGREPGIAVWRNNRSFFSEFHTKHINSLCGQNVELWKLNWWYIY